MIVKVMETRSQEMNKQMALDVLQNCRMTHDHHYETQRTKPTYASKKGDWKEKNKSEKENKKKEIEFNNIFL